MANDGEHTARRPRVIARVLTIVSGVLFASSLVFPFGTQQRNDLIFLNVLLLYTGVVLAYGRGKSAKILHLVLGFFVAGTVLQLLVSSSFRESFRNLPFLIIISWMVAFAGGIVAGCAARLAEAACSSRDQRHPGSSDD
jgi:tellurite resistance protein TehA-like permease